MDLSEAMFTAPEMAACFSSATSVQRMLDFEAALARAEASAGVIPKAAAAAIAARCRAELFDLAALYREGAVAGTSAIPLVRMLTALVDEEARGFVHWGATSQDAIDTGLMLQMREGLDLLIGRLLDVARGCAALADRHRRTPMAGRTLLQHAVPIPFGLKAARWLGLTTRVVRRLRQLRERALVVQLGGAAGTLAALGDDGVRVMELLARELGLAAPDLPWPAERDRIAEIAAALGITAGAMAKIATDLALLSQTEVGEASTRAAGAAGRSSAMPHKRNPVDAMAAAAAARLAIGIVPTVLGGLAQEHERAAGGWQAEWDALPRLFRFTSGAVESVYRAVDGLEVDPARMRANLDLTRGLILAEALMMALAPRLGRDQAYRLVQRASDRAAADGTPLSEVAASDEQIRGVLSPQEIARVFDPSAYMGSADRFIERALEEFRGLTPDPGSG